MFSYDHFTPVIGESRNAEEELNELSQLPPLHDSITTIDLKVLKERFKCSDIYPKVTLELVREQDRKDGRLDLAIEVSKRMARELRNTFKGNKKDSLLVLRVNITVVSDGQQKTKIGNLIGQGKGSAKLTASYCLFSRKTGMVALSKQLSKSQARGSDSRGTLFDLNQELCADIGKEVSFVSYSRIQQWDECFRSMIEHVPIVQKDKQEDSVSSTEGETERSSELDW